MRNFHGIVLYEHKYIGRFSNLYQCIFKDLKRSEVISETVHKCLKPRGFRFGIFYGLCKFHKQLVDNCPSCRPIKSAIKTQLYKTILSNSKKKFINKLMELLWDLDQVLLRQMHFYVSLNRLDLMNVLMNSKLYTTEDMLTTYLFCFVQLILLRN